MKEKGFLNISSAFLLMLFLGSNSLYSQNSTDVKKTKRPNVIYVMADQLRHDAMGYAGNHKAKTPNLDKLASESLNFTNCVSVSPVCAPHRASLLTGKYSSSTGMVVNELRINPNQKTIAHVVSNNGYNTAYFGKWHLYANEAGNHDKIRNAYIPPGPYRLGFDDEWKAFNFHHANYNGYYFENAPVKLQYDKPYEPEAQFDQAIDYVTEHANDENPFFMVLSVGVPHDPWRKEDVPEEYYNMFEDEEFRLPQSWQDTPDPLMDRNTDPERWLNHWKKKIPEFKRGYYAQVASLDDYMGRLMNTLEKSGIEENTIVVFSSDHGETFGENGRVYKMTFYEGAARIPFLIRWKGHIPAGLNSSALINTPDVMPTLLGLMDLPIPEGVEGMDLSSVCLGKGGKEPEIAFLQGMGHTFLWKDGHEWRAVRDKRFTYARYLIDGSELLFDNKKDPLQMNNVVDDPYYQDVYQDLKSKMKSKMEELNDEFKPSSWYRDKWIDESRNIISSAKGKF
jgi:choline-sulfatase